MPEFLTSRVIYESPLVRVTDVRCRAGRCGRAAEEVNSHHSIALPRHGVFVKHVDGQTVTGDSNTVLFFQAGRPYRVSHPCDCGDDCTSFTPAPALLHDALEELDPCAAENPQRPFAFTHGPSGPRTFLNHWRLLRSGPGTELAQDEFVIELLESTLKAAYSVRGARPAGRHAPRTPHTHRAHRDLAEAAKVHLVAHAGGRVDLSGLARAVHSSPYHLSRLFRAHTGTTISEYLLRLRARRAMTALAGGERDLSRAAVMAGFFDHSHLTNAFRREFGVTPRAFRDGDVADTR